MLGDGGRKPRLVAPTHSPDDDDELRSDFRMAQIRETFKIPRLVDSIVRLSKKMFSFEFKTIFLGEEIERIIALMVDF